MYRGEFADLLPQRQPAQEVNVLVAQVCRRPARRRGRVHVELLESEFSDRRQVVVPGDPDVGVLTQQVDASARVRAVSDEVAKFPDLVESAVPPGIVDNALERLKIGVYVGDYKDAQWIGLRTMAQGRGAPDHTLPGWNSSR